MPKLHPADAADIAPIETATEFNVHLRRGPADKINEPAGSIPDAIAIANRLCAENPGRDVLIYAICKDGVTVPVWTGDSFEGLCAYVSQLPAFEPAPINILVKEQARQHDAGPL